MGTWASLFWPQIIGSLLFCFFLISFVHVQLSLRGSPRLCNSSLLLSCLKFLFLLFTTFSVVFCRNSSTDIVSIFSVLVHSVSSTICSRSLAPICCFPVHSSYLCEFQRNGLQYQRTVSLRIFWSCISRTGPLVCSLHTGIFFARAFSLSILRLFMLARIMSSLHFSMALLADTIKSSRLAV